MVINNKLLKCPCCSKCSWIKKHFLPKLIFGANYEIYSCQNCGCGQTFPAPETNVSFYQNNFSYANLFKSNEELYLRFARELVDFYGYPEHNKNRLLDIGCGGGFFVQLAQSKGFNATGVEANTNMVNWGLSRGLDIFAGDLNLYLDSSKELFDVIVLSAVLEHIEDPKQLLRDCLRILSPGGTIIISQASFDGLLPRLFPWGWYGWQPDQHYWHFTPDSLIELTREYGLKVTKIERNSLYHSWYISGGVKNIIARNLATLIAKIGNIFSSGDGFYIALRSSDRGA